MNPLETGDRGAAVVEFVMISVLLIFLLFAILQVAVLFYVRNIVSASAADGARYAASSNVNAPDGAPRAWGEMARALTGTAAHDLPCTGQRGKDRQSGLQTTIVECRGDIKS